RRGQGAPDPGLQDRRGARAVTGLSGWAAFSAGLLSFLSPCVLPLVPGYISFMSGLSLEELAEGASAKSVRRAGGLESLMFVLGVPFLVTGFAVNWFMAFFKKYKPFIRYGEWASGALLIVVGAFIFSGHLTYLIRWVPGYFKKFAQ